jgi:hypothetical protein
VESTVRRRDVCDGGQRDFRASDGRLPAAVIVDAFDFLTFLRLLRLLRLIEPEQRLIGRRRRSQLAQHTFPVRRQPRRLQLLDAFGLTVAVGWSFVLERQPIFLR